MANQSTVTEQQIAEWKEKYGDGNVMKLEVAESFVKFDPHMMPDEDDEMSGPVAVAYIYKPTDKQLSFAMSKMPAFLEAGKTIVKNCFLGGDERIKTDTSMLNAAALQCVELIEIRQAKLKKA